MASVKFQIKRGKKQDLALAEKIPGCWYVTTDTGTPEVYVCSDELTLDPLISGGVVTYSDPGELPSIGKETIVYFIVDDSKTTVYRWSQTELRYKPVLDSSLTIKMIHGGTSKAPESQSE